MNYANQSLMYVCSNMLKTANHFHLFYHDYIYLYVHISYVYTFISPNSRYKPETKGTPICKHQVEHVMGWSVHSCLRLAIEDSFFFDQCKIEKKATDFPTHTSKGNEGILPTVPLYSDSVTSAAATNCKNVIIRLTSVKQDPPHIDQAMSLLNQLNLDPSMASFSIPALRVL